MPRLPTRRRTELPSARGARLEICALTLLVLVPLVTVLVVAAAVVAEDSAVVAAAVVVAVATSVAAVVVVAVVVVVVAEAASVLAVVATPAPRSPLTKQMMDLRALGWWCENPVGRVPVDSPYLFNELVAPTWSCGL